MKFKDYKGNMLYVEGKLGSNLAQTLENNNIFLPFECGFNCECSTCSVEFENEADFELIRDKNPISPSETCTLHQCGKEGL